MLEISPVLAGTFDTADYAPASNNIGSSDAASKIDDRRYTKFDRSATEAGEATMSFGDFVDMVNPLQHLPVISSVYRAVTGDTINPVSRVAGDILYGAITGGASAVMGGVSAVADAAMEASTGKDIGGYMLASLFGSDDKSSAAQGVQLADASTGAPQAEAKQDAVPTLAATPIVPVQLAQASAAPVQAVTAAAASVAAPVNTLAATDASAGTPLAQNQNKFYPLNGVTRRAANTNPYDGESANLAAALAQASPGMRMGHMIYTNKLINGAHPMPIGSQPPVPTTQTATAATPTTASTPAAVTAAASTPVATVAAAPQLSSGQPLTAQDVVEGKLSPALMNDMMLKALNQYKNVAGGNMSSPGLNLDVTN